MTDLPSAQVTIGDLYREITAMRAEVARALSKLEVIESRNTDADRLHADHEARIRSAEQGLLSTAGRVETLAGHGTDQENRIRVLEKFRWQVAGALLLVNSLAVVVEFMLLRK